MTWAPLLVGFAFGFAFAGCIAVLIFTQKPKPTSVQRKQAEELLPWTEEYHSQPQATTTILVKQRRISI